MKVAAVVLALAGYAGCASLGVSEQRMVAAPSRPADCALEYVTDSPTSPVFNQKWQLLGYVAVRTGSPPDPFAQATRDLVRPHACGMGGTSVTMMMGNSDALGGGQVLFAVLRPHPSLDIHSAF